MEHPSFLVVISAVNELTAGSCLQPEIATGRSRHHVTNVEKTGHMENRLLCTVRGERSLVFVWLLASRVLWLTHPCKEGLTWAWGHSAPQWAELLTCSTIGNYRGLQLLKKWLSLHTHFAKGDNFMTTKFNGNCQRPEHYYFLNGLAWLDSSSN